MTSTSYLGSTSIVLQFDLEPQHRRRRARRAGGDQRRARPAAGEPAEQSDLPQGQSGRRADPDPGAHLRHARHRPACTTRRRRSCSRSCRRSRASARSSSAAARCRRCASSSIRPRSTSYGIGLEDVRTALGSANVQPAEGRSSATATATWEIEHHRPAACSAERVSAARSSRYRNGAPVRLADVADVDDSVEDVRTAGLAERQAGGAGDHLPPARAPTSSRPSTACATCCRSSRRRSRRRSTCRSCSTARRRSAPRCTTSSSRC